MGTFTTHLTALADPAAWPAVEKRMRSALADLGLRADEVEVRVQRNYCEEDNMLLDQHMAAHESPPMVEEIHLIRVRSSGGRSGVETERAITKALVGALPEGAGWYGTTVGGA